ncbi:MULTISPECIES: tyrosine-type recombinase/integrase [unclassified Pseudofrankia]|uniref:tyrosine-type recombinase/integrase n=1 Tax=unclassified Pseudofrankia TaxID=2994372 RepID=UPI0008DA71F5|nr:MULTISPECIES: tyrosine-type recombinase/integrase [unclassified Pseudofrankia]MDT3445157.1 tyrosine-type recombinase/integrase [Pseudofrankia sp. BMG5.37]OHV63226.1 hypothetical protein BCD48_38335 [Pseudofrankia sp. BMG5.36]
MTALAGQVEDYLRLRRALGYRLEREERWLTDFCSYLQVAGTTTIGSRLAIEWAKLPAGASPAHWAQRLGVVHRFAIWLHTLDPATEIPPTGVFPARRHRATPYLFTDDQIRDLLARARALHPPLRAASLHTLLGLLAVSGMRIGEAVTLRRDDLDLDTGLITIRLAKHDRERLVPLHPTATAALRRYAAERDRLCPRPRAETFFLSSTGGRLDRSDVGRAFRRITTEAGIRDETTHPRIHDLRHGFALQTLIRWTRAGLSVDANIAVLSTYLGHVAPSDTYWYLSAAPELMELAAQRLATRPRHTAGGAQ